MNYFKSKNYVSKIIIIFIITIICILFLFNTCKGSNKDKITLPIIDTTTSIIIITPIDTVTPIDTLKLKKIFFVFEGEKIILNDSILIRIDKEFNLIFKNYPTINIYIEDNIDNIGNLNENRNISKKRVKFIEEYIIKKYNLLPSQIISKANGSTKAISDGVIGTNNKYKWTSLEIIK